MPRRGRGKRREGMYDAAIIGGGLAGTATAVRLQASGLSTIVLEAHGQPGGCAGFFRRGFSLRRGSDHARRLRPGGVGGELLESVGMMPIEGETLPGYVAWLPDRTVTLLREPAAWSRERLEPLGDTPGHRAFWRLLDRLAESSGGPAGAGSSCRSGRGRCDPRGAGGRPGGVAPHPLPALDGGRRLRAYGLCG